MKRVRALFGVTLILLVASIMFLQPGTRSDPAGSTSRQAAGVPEAAGSPGEIVVGGPVTPVLTVAVRDLPPFVFEPTLDREVNPRQNPYNRTDPDVRIDGGPDPLLAVQASAPAASDRDFDTPIFNFAGRGFTGANPPDTVGDVGANHYIQMVNGGGTVVSIFDKATGTPVTTFALTSLGGCATGGGDPVVLYDQAADRWLLSEFGSGSSLCVFISQTPDPTGAYYSYRFTTPSFPDYPKYGVWPDAYYVSTNESNPAAYAFDRTRMLAGLPATSQRFAAPDLPGFGFQALTPSDLDGATPPPAGAPNYFMRHRDTEVHGPGGLPTEDLLEVWAFHVDWTTPANSTFTQVASIAVAEFDSDLCGLFSFFAIAMPGVPKCAGSSLDPLREVIMFRLAYRHFGDYETLVGNLATDVTGADDAGVRWFELRKTGANPWVLQQEGTYAPDLDSRWMGAIAMDGAGNIAVGYNVSSGATFPSLRYAGRLASDPPGTLPQGEYNIIAGSGVNGSNRYGDYSAMSVDPEDDCTFWFTGMYNATSQWSTRIAAFKFDACGTPDFTITAEPETFDACIPDGVAYDVTIGQIGGYAQPVSLSVAGVPGGYDSTFTVNPVIPPGMSQLQLTNVGAGSPGSYPLTITGLSPTSTHTTTVSLNLYDGVPGTTTLISPANGATGVSPVPTFTWVAAANAIGYDLAVATDPGFSNVIYTASVAGTSHTSGITLNPLTTYYWTVTPTNACGPGTPATPFSFTTLDVPPILLVDDDDNNPDVRGAYTAALDALGLVYDIWDTANSDNEPPAATLMQYDMVVWFSGDEFGGAAGPGSAGEASLATYLDAGNCLFMSSQDYLYDRGLTPFLDTYLGVGAFSNDVGQTSVTGAGSVYGAIPTTALTYPFTNYSDRVVPDAAAELAFSGNVANAGVNYENGFRTTFLGFPIEAMPLATRQDVLAAAMAWCDAGPNPLATLNVTWALNNGSSGSDAITLYDDGTFGDADGNSGLWGLRTSPARLRFLYNDGSNCAAFSLGFFQGGGALRGYRLCRDGSGAAGVWQGTLAPTVMGVFPE